MKGSDFRKQIAEAKTAKLVVEILAEYEKQKVEIYSQLSEARTALQLAQEEFTKCELHLSETRASYNPQDHTAAEVYAKQRVMELTWEKLTK